MGWEGKGRDGKGWKGKGKEKGKGKRKGKGKGKFAHPNGISYALFRYTCLMGFCGVIMGVPSASKRREAVPHVKPKSNGAKTYPAKYKDFLLFTREQSQKKG